MKQPKLLVITNETTNQEELHKPAKPPFIYTDKEMGDYGNGILLISISFRDKFSVSYCINFTQQKSSRQ
jgi:hypothetical protein